MAARRTTLLIDGDILIMKASCVSQKTINWGDVTTTHSKPEDVITSMQGALSRYVLGLGLNRDKTDFLIALSSASNFRKDIYPEYKANRTGSKPVGYEGAREWLEENYSCISIEGIEADDVLGILGTSSKYKGHCYVVSDDKDLLQIPGLVWRPMAGEVFNVSTKSGDKVHAMQTLKGDQIDNYPGLPGVGQKKAEAIVEAGLKAGDLWGAVEHAFTSRGHTYDDMMLMARVSKILRVQDYDFKKKEPILWHPPE